MNITIDQILRILSSLSDDELESLDEEQYAKALLTSSLIPSF
jgi:hypothetical protein